MTNGSSFLLVFICEDFRVVWPGCGETWLLRPTSTKPVSERWIIAWVIKHNSYSETNTERPREILTSFVPRYNQGWFCATLFFSIGRKDRSEAIWGQRDKTVCPDPPDREDGRISVHTCQLRVRPPHPPSIVKFSFLFVHKLVCFLWSLLLLFIVVSPDKAKCEKLLVYGIIDWMIPNSTFYTVFIQWL